MVKAFGSLEAKISPVVTMAPTMVTNMTGFLIITAGFSFLKESASAGTTMDESNREWAFALIYRFLSDSAQYSLGAPDQRMKCSTIGPRASAGRKFSAPTSSTVPISSQVKVAPETGNEPGPGGISFFAASEPAMAMMGTIMRKRPINMAKASVVSYQ